MARLLPEQQRDSMLADIALPLFSLAIIYMALFVAPKLIAPPRLTPEQSHHLDELSATLIKQSKFADALPAVTDLHEAYPQNQTFVERIAEIDHHLGRFDDEAEAWEEYMQIAPTPLAACPQIGRAYQLDGEKQKAISAFQRCLNVDPANSDSMLFLALALEQNRDFSRAEALYTTALAQSPNYPDLKIGLTRTKLEQGRISDDAADAAELARQYPDNADAVFLLGLAYLKNGQVEEAKFEFARGEHMAPRDADFLVGLACVADAEHRPADARLLYARVLELDPNNEEAGARVWPVYMRWKPLRKLIQRWRSRG